ncbi:MAG: DUF4012 domain-containing protein [Candidatus Shapirobacteria bacterium]
MTEEIEINKIEVKEKKKLERKKLLLIGLGIFFGIILILGLIIGLPVRSLYAKGMALKEQAGRAKSALASKDLGQIRAELDGAGQKLEDLERSYHKLGWLKIIPKVKNYYLDGRNLIAAGKEGLEAGKIVLVAVEPYQDFLGLGEQAAGDGEKTTEDRIEFLTESITGLKPQLDQLEQKVAVVNELVGEVDPRRYPDEFRGMAIKENLILAQRLIGEMEVFLKEGKPLIEKMDYLLGKDEPRKYLVLFQNDGEIRPTGGFWTAYGILEVNNGKFSPLISEDIYALDSRFNSNLPAPDPIKKYLKNVFYWNLRDLNLSPDFKVSVEQFWPYYQKVAQEKDVDGIIAVDTNVLVSILEVIGRIGVPGWGNFYADPEERCWGCPQVVYLLEELADQPINDTRSNRKGFIGPVMHSLLSNAMGQPKEKIAPLAQAIIDDLNSKHILVYFFDPELQKAIEKLKYGGRIVDFEGDYFHFNDANLGGAKSNLFITQEIRHDYEVRDGKISKKVSVKFENTAPASNCNLEAGELCLNGLYRDWFRFYLPRGSKLVNLTGSEEEAKVYEDLGKTVIEGFFGEKFPLYPKGISKVSVEYSLPFEAPSDSLPLLIQKQPGKDEVKHEIYVNGKKQTEIMVNGDAVANVAF